MEKEFCPVCGNHTLQRIAMTVNDDGSIQYFMSRRKPVNLRGLRVCRQVLEATYGFSALICLHGIKNY